VTTIQRMRWWHLDDVVALEKQLFDGEPWTAGTFWSELGQLDTRHYLVSIGDGRLQGYAGLCAYSDEAFVQTLGVAPHAQGKGLGAQLLQALLDEAARRRTTPVLLEVRADNDRALRLYERFGFRRTGVRRGYYQPSGTDALVMTRA